MNIIMANFNNFHLAWKKVNWIALGGEHVNERNNVQSFQDCVYEVSSKLKESLEFANIVQRALVYARSRYLQFGPVGYDSSRTICDKRVSSLCDTKVFIYCAVYLHCTEAPGLRIKLHWPSSNYQVVHQNPCLSRVSDACQPGSPCKSTIIEGALSICAILGDWGYSESLLSLESPTRFYHAKCWKVSEPGLINFVGLAITQRLLIFILRKSLLKIRLLPLMRATKSETSVHEIQDRTVFVLSWW